MEKKLPVVLVSTANNILAFNSDFSDIMSRNKQITSDNKELVIDMESNMVISSSSSYKTEYMTTVVTKSGELTKMCIKIFPTVASSTTGISPPYTFVLLPYESPLLTLDFLVHFMFNLRTSLSNIIQTLNLLNQRIPKEYIKILNSSSLDTIRMVNDVTDFSNLEENKIILEQKPFSLESCVAEAFSIIIKQKTILKDTYILKNTPVNVIGDNDKLSLILCHLLKNSKKAVSGIKAAVISIKLKTIPSDLPDFTNFLFEVKDNGSGISFQKKQCLFDETNVGKLQFGLSICKGLTTLMNGKIWCKDSETDLGSIFCFNVHLKIQ